jgi:hypothetical protein
VWWNWVLRERVGAMVQGLQRARRLFLRAAGRWPMVLRPPMVRRVASVAFL